MESLYKWTLQKGANITQQQLEAEWSYSYDDDPDKFKLDLLRMKAKLKRCSKHRRHQQR